MPQHDSDEQRAWERGCSEAITSDVLWKLDAYRAAMFLLHTARQDCRSKHGLRADPWLASQLIRAAGSVGANLAEGYSRSTRADRVRFVSYALASVRECVPWYEALRGALPDGVVDARMLLVARIRSILLGLVRSLRDDGGTASRLEH